MRVTLGLFVVYRLSGLAASAAGRALIANLPAFGRVAARIIIVFGLPCLGVMRLPFLNLEWRCHTGRIGVGFSPSFSGWASHLASYPASGASARCHDCPRNGC